MRFANLGTLQTEMPGSRSKSSRLGITLIELLVTILIIAVLITLILPAIQMAREVARRDQCIENLKQIGAAMQGYESSNAVFPSGGKSTNFSVSPPATHFVDGGWSPLAWILPYMEGGSTYNALNFAVAYNEATGMNYTGASVVVRVFICPSSAVSAS